MDRNRQVFGYQFLRSKMRRKIPRKPSHKHSYDWDSNPDQELPQINKKKVLIWGPYKNSYLALVVVPTVVVALLMPDAVWVCIRRRFFCSSNCSKILRFWRSNNQHTITVDLLRYIYIAPYLVNDLKMFKIG